MHVFFPLSISIMHFCSIKFKHTSFLALAFFFFSLLFLFSLLVTFLFLPIPSLPSTFLTTSLLPLCTLYFCTLSQHLYFILLIQFQRCSFKRLLILYFLFPSDHGSSSRNGTRRRENWDRRLSGCWTGCRDRRNVWYIWRKGRFFVFHMSFTQTFDVAQLLLYEAVLSWWWWFFSLDFQNRKFTPSTRSHRRRLLATEHFSEGIVDEISQWTFGHSHLNF